MTLRPRSDLQDAVLSAAITLGVLDADPPLAVLYDLDSFRGALRAARAAFPEGSKHALAMKANPIGPLLREALDLGFAVECASAAEVRHAQNIGFAPERIVFDSPAKTAREIHLALSSGLHLNIDNLQELSRVAAFFAERPSSSIVGLRVNPSVGAGSIVSSSTAIPTSKFGVTIGEHKAEIIEAFRAFSFLRGLHVHVGSQGCPLDLAAEGARRAVVLAQEIEAACGRKVSVLDIGGGLPVSYDGSPPPTFAEYAEKLRERAPELFDGTYQLVTEFGRAISAAAGWVASRVEYTKMAGGRKIAVIHAGGDLFVRTAYLPHQWSHRVTVHDSKGALKKGASEEPWDIAGPLCFSGDLVARERLLPPIEPGDIIVVHDAGAYTLSMWSRYNSRRAPAVFGHDGDPPVLKQLKAAESEDGVLAFWG